MNSLMLAGRISRLPESEERQNWLHHIADMKRSREAESIYKRVMNPRMLLWLVKSFAPRKLAKKAKRAGKKARKKASVKTKYTSPAYCAAVRKVVPWKVIERNGHTG